MVLLFAKEGQLANRLWQSSFFIANAIEHNYSLLHLGFAEYIIYFNENVCVHSCNARWRIIDFETTLKKDRLLIKYANLSKAYFEKHNRHYPFIRELNFFDYAPQADGYDLSQKKFLKTVRSNIVLVDGWQFIDNSSFKKHANTLRKIFTPNKKYVDNVESLKQECYIRYDVVVGVHLRKGDYATFNKGKWLFSNADYVSFMRQVKAFPSFSNKKVGFLLCSDGQINSTDFEEFGIVCTNNNFIEDLYALSFCDLIIGPPSTYSSWASFYGNKPLLHITELDMRITEQGFKIAP
ncbi:MAG: hypothetical protein JWR61_5310 [Ferruginibacter sp.]|uniref:alpha-1,2-fucosyltransferase n=1 Tax=Ferruginibacter sp. TaxID=1940288 RepID=UPI002657F9B9|nr:alpha-1,2-fucosyltransferase [Ferruginibacter sp.]MDB5280355.1 hypothetical protein [Ferruginibacter sp.]